MKGVAFSGAIVALDCQFDAPNARFSSSSLQSRGEKSARGRVERESTVEREREREQKREHRLTPMPPMPTMPPGKRRENVPHHLRVEKLAVWADTMLIAELFWSRD